MPAKSLIISGKIESGISMRKVKVEFLTYS